MITRKNNKNSWNRDFHFCSQLLVTHLQHIWVASQIMEVIEPCRLESQEIESLQLNVKLNVPKKDSNMLVDNI